MRILLLVLFSTILISCAQQRSQLPQYTQAELEKEQAIQEKIVKEKGKAQSSEDVARTKAHIQRVSDIVPDLRMHAMQMCADMNISQNKCNFNFKVTEDGPTNAFADGRTVHITPAMIDTLNTKSKLAFVLAHEYAHNLMRHVQSTQQNVGLGAIAGLVLDQALRSQGVDTGGQLAKMGSTVAQLRYSKGFEQEADYVGMYILARTGYDISNVADVWREASVRNPDAIYMASTHPTNPERFIALSKTVEEINIKKNAGRVLTPDQLPES